MAKIITERNEMRASVGSKIVNLNRITEELSGGVIVRDFYRLEIGEIVDGDTHLQIIEETEELYLLKIRFDETVKAIQGVILEKYLEVEKSVPTVIPITPMDEQEMNNITLVQVMFSDTVNELVTVIEDTLPEWTTEQRKNLLRSIVIRELLDGLETMEQNN